MICKDLSGETASRFSKDEVSAMEDLQRRLARAKSLEDLFIQRVESKIALLSTVKSPLDGRRYAATSDSRRVVRRNRGAHILEILRQEKVFDRDVLAQLPQDEALHCSVFTKSFWGGQTPRVALIAAVRSPLAGLLSGTQPPLSASDVQDVLEALAREKGVFTYIGIASTTGWTPETLGFLPATENAAVCLISRPSVDSTAWKVESALDERWGDLLALFDPETDEEKVARALEFLRKDPSLSLRGGHIKFLDIADQLKIPLPLMERAVAHILGQDRELSITTLDGVKILKRARL